jgi:L-ribulose-5-phosphate 3-epimerase
MVYENRLGAHVGSYHSYRLEDALDGIAAAGFRYVELSAVRGWNEHVPLASSTAELRAIQRRLNDLGLVAMSLSGHSDLTTKPGLRQGLRALALCEKLGIGIMNTAIGGHYKEHEDLSGFLANIDALADAAAALHVTLAIEIHGEITNNAKNALAVLKQIGRDDVKINYDTANVEFYSGVRAEDDVRFAAAHMAHCHLKDKIGGARVWNFPAIGAGHVDFASVFKTLKRGGYHGPYSVELEFTDKGWPPLDTVNAAMKRSFKTLTGLGLRA